MPDRHARCPESTATTGGTFDSDPYRAGRRMVLPCRGARGPTDAWSGAALMVTGLLLGALAGLVLRRRAGVLFVLLAHAAAFELVRRPVDAHPALRDPDLR